MLQPPVGLTLRAPGHPRGYLRCFQIPLEAEACGRPWDLHAAPDAGGAYRTVPPETETGRPREGLFCPFQLSLCSSLAPSTEV